MTPAEELRAAAAKLRETAAAATEGPWTLTKQHQKWTSSHVQSTWTRPPRPGSNIVQDKKINPHQHDDYAWICLMGPDKAELIAAWLDAEATCQESLADGKNVLPRVLDAIAGKPTGIELTTSFDTVTQCLAVARAINGGAA